MKPTAWKRLGSALLTAGLVVAIAKFAVNPASAQQNAKGKGGAAANTITGVVQGDKGPEGGVWVIAETKDLQTGFIKIVVTGDDGRFLIPDLPTNATYSVWSRGYGIADTAKQTLKAGASNITIKASTVTGKEAAKVYPGNYWLSMLEPPAKNLFPGKGDGVNGLGPTMLTQDHWINQLKSGCNFCHQLGNQLTRSVDHVMKAHPESKTHEDAWEWRLRVGVRGTQMYSVMTQQGKTATLKSLADWTRSVEAGAVPPAPPRPKGIERNIVATLWDVGDDHSFMHDQVSTDKNHPSVNAGGKVYAVNAGHGSLVSLDPRENFTTSMNIPTRDDAKTIRSRFPAPDRASFFWGWEHLWSNPPTNNDPKTYDYDPADPHNPMFDSKGNVWLTAKIRSAEPAWCNDGSNKFSDWYPLRNSGRQAAKYDPKTQKWDLIDTCYSTHHLQFDNDPNETLYFNELSGPYVGWVDTKVYSETLAKTKDPIAAEKAANGWCGQVLDTNGDGKITRPWNVLATARGGEDSVLYAGDTTNDGNKGGAKNKGKAAPAPFDPKLDTMVSYSLYSMIPSPVDDSVWGVSEVYPGMLVRVIRGNNAPESCKAQIFKIPAPGYDPRGIDVDTNGVVWTALAATSHLASFDVRKCKDLNGPAKTDGSQCKEGWTLYQTDGPKFKGTDVPSEFHYYNWVDQQGIISAGGLGKNTPYVTGSNSDSLIALNPQTKEWTYFRIPYPLGFYSRGMDGRIDDPSPNAGWRGRALYSNYGTHFVWHIEGGKGTKGKIVKFQVRPNPLAN